MITKNFEFVSTITDDDFEDFLRIINGIDTKYNQYNNKFIITIKKSNLFKKKIKIILFIFLYNYKKRLFFFFFFSFIHILQSSFLYFYLN